MGNGHLCPGDPGDRSSYNSGKIEVQGCRGVASNIISPVVTAITIVANIDIPRLITANEKQAIVTVAA